MLDTFDVLWESGAQIMLLYPLLDATFQHPEIGTIAKQDPHIGPEGSKLAVAAYSKGDDLNNYMLSAINGKLEGLAPIHLFMGTDEILLPDARKLVALAEAKHVYMIIMNTTKCITVGYF